MGIPAPVPALPDAERRTTYMVAGSAGPFAVNFALYGDSTDYTNWLEVWINGQQIAQAGNWTLTSPTGPLATIPRPITDAVITFIVPQTGTLQIVGARRPRRVSQYSENGGVSARDLNQTVSDIIATEREFFDGFGRSIMAPPGETMLPLPPAASRAGLPAAFDSFGNMIAALVAPPTATVSSIMAPILASASTTVARALLGILLATPIDAINYGVVGDGVTNDYSKLQSALNAAAGGRLVIGPGTYSMGGGVLTVPDNTTVICSRNTIIRRTADVPSPGAGYNNYLTGPMVLMGKSCRWEGGVLDNNVVTAQSTTANSVATTGTKTFSVPAGLPFQAGDYLRIYSRSNPANHGEGSVSSYVYSGTGTIWTLTVNLAFASGSVTASDWNINYAAVYMCAMLLHGSSKCIIDGLRVTGFWYAGFVCDGWNPTTGGSLNAQSNTFRNCRVESAQNRAFYLYGTCWQNLFQGCFVDGGNGTTDYAFNTDPANVSGTVNSIIHNKFLGCDAIGPAFQGFAISDNAAFNIIDSCTVTSMPNAGAIGFLIQTANAGIPQRNQLSNCIADQIPNGSAFAFSGAFYGGASRCLAVSCLTGVLIEQGTQVIIVGTTTTTNIIPSSYVSFSGDVDSCNTGIAVINNSVDIDLLAIKVTSCTGAGVQVTAGSANTQITGRSVANGTNIIDAGSGTIRGGLVTV